MPFSEHQRAILLKVASDAIQHGLRTGRAPKIDPASVEDALRVERATFVTLLMHGDLRGCIGMLEACRPLVVDVAENAFAAAFEDPRFPPVTTREFQALEIHLSILSPPEPMTIRDEADLLRQLRPGHDGLIIQDGFRRATFLPSVWEELPEPAEFLAHLKRKAGLRTDHWSPRFKAERYETESFP